MTRIRIGLALGVALAAASCGPVNQEGHFTMASTMDEASVALPVDPRSVQLVAGSPRAIFTPIREVEVTVNRLTPLHPAPTENDARRALQQEAARIGANAVINVEISGPQISPISSGVRKGTGLAVRF